MQNHHTLTGDFPIQQDPVELENHRQEKLKEEAIARVKNHAYHMQRSFDNNDIGKAIKYAADMCQELTTGKLYPERYYELYLAVTMELTNLQDKIDSISTTSRTIKLTELYDLVQHCGNIIPRLYLLCTIGSSLIKSEEKESKLILNDLVRLCRGVQHPLRGLFLRDYLSRVSKDKLPDSFTSQNATIKDSSDFLLENFGEMNKLWVRMQHQGAQKDRSRREQERQRVQMLIGKSLERISRLPLSVETYSDMILPKILELTINCRDALAQEYLMEVIVKIFDDAFHLATLSQFLGAMDQLVSEVKSYQILRVLMNRLANYARDSPEAFINPTLTQEIFPLFHSKSEEITSKFGKNMALKDVVGLQAALANLSSKCYPDRLDYLDSVLGFTSDAMSARISSASQHADAKVVSQVAALLRAPLETLGIRILELEKYPILFQWFDLDTRTSISCDIIRSIINKQHSIDSADKVEKLFSLISPLLKDEQDTPPLTEDNQFEFDQEQFLVSKLIHFINHSDFITQFSLFITARKYFGQGGLHRFQHTLVPLVFRTLEMTRKAWISAQADSKAKKMLQFVHEIISALCSHFPEISLRLFLNAAQVADFCGFENIAYEFMAQAFIVYEDEISDSKAQFADITLITGTLQTLNCFTGEEENYDTFATKCTQHSAKLLRKPDQCRAICNCSHLFFYEKSAESQPSVKFNPKLVLQCLVKSLKIANSIVNVDQKVALFVEIFNKYLYFRYKNCDTILEDHVRDLKALIDENINSIDVSLPDNVAIITEYKNTLEHVTKLVQAKENSGNHDAEPKDSEDSSLQE